MTRTTRLPFCVCFSTKFSNCCRVSSNLSGTETWRWRKLEMSVAIFQQYNVFKTLVMNQCKNYFPVKRLTDQTKNVKRKFPSFTEELFVIFQGCRWVAYVFHSNIFAFSLSYRMWPAANYATTARLILVDQIKRSMQHDTIAMKNKNNLHCDCSQNQKSPDSQQ